MLSSDRGGGVNKIKPISWGEDGVFERFGKLEIPH